MSRIAVAIACSCAAAACPSRGEGIEFEVGAGPAFVVATERDAPISPTLSLRGAYGWSGVSFGPRLIFILGPEASERPGGSTRDSSGFQAVAALAEASFHGGEGRLSGGLRFAAGVGSVIGLNCNCEETPPLHGGLAPTILGSAFASLRASERYRVSLELAAIHFWGLEHGRGPFTDARTDLEAWSVLLLLSLGLLQR
jgi:hypothetical protein